MLLEAITRRRGSVKNDLFFIEILLDYSSESSQKSYYPSPHFVSKSDGQSEGGNEL